MQILKHSEIDSVFGGTETAPVCTTSGGTTSCTCPVGMHLAFEQSAKVVVMTCTDQPVTNR